MQVGLGRGHILLDGTHLRLRQRGTAPNFRPISVVVKMAVWIKMPLGMEVGLGSGDFVLNGDPAPLPEKGRAPSPIFGPCPM